jgi:hypothetical protein
MVGTKPTEAMVGRLPTMLGCRQRAKQLCNPSIVVRILMSVHPDDVRTSKSASRLWQMLAAV